MHTFAPSQLQQKCGGVASMTAQDWHSQGLCTKCGSTTNYVQGTWTRIRRRPPRWWLYGCPTPCCQCSTASWLQHEQETGVLGGCPPLQRLTVVASLRPRAELQLVKHAGWQHHRLRCLGGELEGRGLEAPTSPTASAPPAQSGSAAAASPTPGAVWGVARAAIAGYCLLRHPRTQRGCPLHVDSGGEQVLLTLACVPGCDARWRGLQLPPRQQWAWHPRGV